MYRAANSYPRPPIANIRAMSSTRGVFTGDLYVIDGGSGKTRALVDHNDLAHWLDQPDTTKQCVLPASHADYAGKMCLDLTGNEWLVANSAAASWAGMHNGTGMSMHGVITPINTSTTKIFAATSPAGLTGFAFHTLISGSMVLTLRAGNASASIAGAGFAGLTSAVPVQFSYQYKEGGSPEHVTKVTGQSEAPGSSAGDPDLSSPPSTLVVGARTSDFGLRYVGRIRAFVFGPVYSAAERSLLRTLLHQDSGVAA
jgi:hypothetical protein